jgi:predicted nucleotidyltransferase
VNQPGLDTARFLRRFRDAGARVVLIGGMAAVALGVPYLTQDIDFCYDPAPENRPRLVEALAPLQPRLRVEGMPDDAARALPWRWDERTLRDAPNLTLQTDAGPIDLLSQVTGLGGYAEVLQEAVTLQIEGQEIAVLDLPGLLRAKRAAGRAKDAAVLPLLESTLLLREQAHGSSSEEPPDSAAGKGMCP